MSTSSGLASMASGGKFWQGFATGAVSSFVSSATDGICKMCEVPKGWTKAAVVAAGCLSGGVTATMAGGNFWEGVCSGLICAGLNHAMHMIVGPDDPPDKKTKNKPSNKNDKVVEGSAVISGEAAIVKTAADWAAGGSKIEILNGISKWSKRIGIACTAINVVINMDKAYHGEILWTSFVVRTVVSGVEVGVAAIPMAGPILSSMIVCYDIGGGFDKTLYNDDWIHKIKP